LKEWNCIGRAGKEILKLKTEVFKQEGNVPNYKLILGYGHQDLFQKTWKLI
jgi:hypothetical protein